MQTPCQLPCCCHKRIIHVWLACQHTPRLPWAVLTVESLVSPPPCLAGLVITTPQGTLVSPTSSQSFVSGHPTTTMIVSALHAANAGNRHTQTHGFTHNSWDSFEICRQTAFCCFLQYLSLKCHSWHTIIFTVFISSIVNFKGIFYILPVPREASLPLWLRAVKIFGICIAIV